MTATEMALFFGAAVEDANDWQLTALRAYWVENGDGYRAGTVTWKRVENAVLKIMGPAWQPQRALGIAASA